MPDDGSGIRGMPRQKGEGVCFGDRACGGAEFAGLGARTIQPENRTGMAAVWLCRDEGGGANDMRHAGQPVFRYDAESAGSKTGGTGWANVLMQGFGRRHAAAIQFTEKFQRGFVVGFAGLQGDFSLAFQ